MDWTSFQQGVVDYYTTVAVWVYAHPVRTDIIVGLVALGSIAYLISRKASVRRKARRIRWGIRMRRSKSREAFEKSLISYGIMDSIEEAVYRGEMTRASADQWYHMFANAHQMDELLPVKDVKSIKRGIRWRLSKGVHLVKNTIPGAMKPWSWADITGLSKPKGIDPNYKPVHIAPKRGTESSKYRAA